MEMHQILHKRVETPADIEAAKQYAIWAWRQSPLFPEACEVYKNGDDEALSEYLYEKHKELQIIYEELHPDLLDWRELHLKFDEDNTTIEYVAECWHNVPLTVYSEIGISKPNYDLMNRLFKTVLAAVQFEEQGVAAKFKEMQTFCMKADTMLGISAYFMIPLNTFMLAWDTGDRLKGRGDMDIDKLYESGAEDWKNLKKRMDDLAYARNRWGNLFMVLVFAAFLAGLGLIVTYTGGGKTAYLFLTIAISLAAICFFWTRRGPLASLIAFFCTAGPLGVIDTIWHVSDYVPNFFYGLAVIAAVLGLWAFLASPGRKKCIKISVELRPELERMRNFYGIRYAALQRYEHSLGDMLKRDYEMAKGYNKAIEKTADRINEIADFLVTCPEKENLLE